MPKKSKDYNEKNPLYQYKVSKDKKWIDISYESRITIAQLISIAKMKKEDIGNLRVKTLILLKKKCKVDLFNTEY